MFEASRLMALKHGFLGIFSSNSKDEATLVVVKQLLLLNPKLHQISYFTPLRMKFVLVIGEVGSSSFVYIIRMTDDKTGELLGENFLKYVRIGRTSRRAELLPSWFREKYSSKIDDNLPSTFKRSVPPEIPSNAFRFTLQPLASDMDSNGHVNQSVYLKYCTDAAFVAVRAGYLKQFRDDICRYPTTSWDVSYLGESFAGDTLVVSMWQDAEKHELIFFSIEREKKKIFYCISTFDTESQQKKAEYVQSKV
ncbi:hypothetical protein FSP39_003861 [Pinctada imbricata]|uniref:Uncharacterized protein n=1 Tax=Pinctada imbricata TaxID=66713 RepID=A0AA89BYE4_PINIB|nr:hypothetical protein FSP39_003861 [Pinctada imbricata]